MNFNLNDEYEKIKMEQFQQVKVLIQKKGRIICIKRFIVIKSKKSCLKSKLNRYIGQSVQIFNKSKKATKDNEQDGYDAFLTGCNVKEEKIYQKSQQNFQYQYVDEKVGQTIQLKKTMMQQIIQMNQILIILMIQQDQGINIRYRMMIKETKGEIYKYAGETYGLNSKVSQVNKKFQKSGMGVNDQVFDPIDYQFNKHMPGGTTNKLFKKI